MQLRSTSFELGLTKGMNAIPLSPRRSPQSASERRRLRGDGSPEPVIGTCRRSWCDRSIQNARHSVVRSGYRNRKTVRSSRRANHLGSGHHVRSNRTYDRKRSDNTTYSTCKQGAVHICELGSNHPTTDGSQFCPVGLLQRPAESTACKVWRTRQDESENWVLLTARNEKLSR